MKTQLFCFTNKSTRMGVRLVLASAKRSPLEHIPVCGEKKGCKFSGDESFTLPLVSVYRSSYNKDISLRLPLPPYEWRAARWTMFACVKMSIKMWWKRKEIKNSICSRWFTIVLKVFSPLRRPIERQREMRAARTESKVSNGQTFEQFMLC